MESIIEALRGIDRAYVYQQLSQALEALPFDYRTAVAYVAIGLGAYTFAWLLYRLLTEPKRKTRALLNSSERSFYTSLMNVAQPLAVYPKISPA